MENEGIEGLLHSGRPPNEGRRAVGRQQLRDRMLVQGTNQQKIVQGRGPLGRTFVNSLEYVMRP
jgi:hypothetical protein